MTINELITRSKTKYPILSLYAGPNEIVRRINCAEMEDDEILQIIHEKMEEFPDSQIKANFYSKNGNSPILKESYSVDRPKKEEKAEQQPFMPIALGNPGVGGEAGVYMLQIQMLQQKVNEVTAELKEVKAENKTLTRDNGEMKIQLATIEKENNVQMTLQGIEQDNSFGSIIKDTLPLLIEMIGKSSDGGKSLSEDVALVVETMNPLDAEHKRHLLGLLRAYAQHPAEAKALFEKIYQSASEQQNASEQPTTPPGGTV